MISQIFLVKICARARTCRHEAKTGTHEVKCVCGFYALFTHVDAWIFTKIFVDIPSKISTIQQFLQVGKSCFNQSLGLVSVTWSVIIPVYALITSFLCVTSYFLPCLQSSLYSHQSLVLCLVSCIQSPVSSLMRLFPSLQSLDFSVFSLLSQVFCLSFSYLDNFIQCPVSILLQWPKTSVYECVIIFCIKLWRNLVDYSTLHSYNQGHGQVGRQADRATYQWSVVIKRRGGQHSAWHTKTQKKEKYHYSQLALVIGMSNKEAQGIIIKGYQDGEQGGVNRLLILGTC